MGEKWRHRVDAGQGSQGRGQAPGVSSPRPVLDPAQQTAGTACPHRGWAGPTAASPPPSEARPAPPRVAGAAASCDKCSQASKPHSAPFSGSPSQHHHEVRLCPDQDPPGQMPFPHWTLCCVTRSTWPAPRSGFSCPRLTEGARAVSHLPELARRGPTGLASKGCALSRSRTLPRQHPPRAGPAPCTQRWREASAAHLSNGGQGPGVGLPDQLSLNCSGPCLPDPAPHDRGLLSTSYRALVTARRRRAHSALGGAGHGPCPERQSDSVYRCARGSAPQRGGVGCRAAGGELGCGGGGVVLGGAGGEEDIPVTHRARLGLEPWGGASSLLSPLCHRDCTP